MIVDPVYGYQAINVEAQLRTPVVPAQLDEAHHRGAEEDARLRARDACASCGPATRACWPTCASTRARRVLAVHNLSGAAQPVELDLSPWVGHTPHRDARREPVPARSATGPTSSASPRTATTGSASSRRSATSRSMASRTCFDRSEGAPPFDGRRAPDGDSFLPPPKTRIAPAKPALETATPQCRRRGFDLVATSISARAISDYRRGGDCLPPFRFYGFSCGVLVVEIVTPSDVVAPYWYGQRGAALKEYLRRQRWFAAKARGVDHVRVEDWAVLDLARPLLLALLDVDGERVLPAPGASRRRPRTATRLRASGRGSDRRWATSIPAFGRTDARGDQRAGREIPARGAAASLCRPMSPVGRSRARDGSAALDVRRLSGEQSNTSIAIGRELILKSLRRPRRGVNPEVEITRVPHAADRVPRTCRRSSGGWTMLDRPARRATVSVLQGFVDNTATAGATSVARSGRRGRARVLPGHARPKAESRRSPDPRDA